MTMKNRIPNIKGSAAADKSTANSDAADKKAESTKTKVVKAAKTKAGKAKASKAKAVGDKKGTAADTNKSTATETTGIIVHGTVVPSVQTEAIEAAATRVRGIMNRMSLSGLKGYWEYGDVLLDLRTKTGDDASVRALARHINADYNTAAKALLFRQRYSEAQLNVLCDKQMASGGVLTWTHMLHLLSVEDTKTRQLLVSATLADSLTATELHARVTELHGGNRRSGSGRRFAALVKPAQLTKLVLPHVQNLQRRLQSHMSALPRALAKAESTDLPTLQAMIKHVGDLHVHVQQLMQSLGEAIKTLRQGDAE